MKNNYDSFEYIKEFINVIQNERAELTHRLNELDKIEKEIILMLSNHDLYKCVLKDNYNEKDMEK